MRAAVPFVLILALVLPASAVQQQRPVGRFDAFILQREGAQIPLAPRAIATLDAADGLRQGWERFARLHGDWTTYVDERSGLPTLASGRGIRWFAADALDGLTLADVEQRVRAFLDENRVLMGGRWDEVLELDLDASRERRPGTWRIVMRQSVDGVRVENARLDFHVQQGRLTMFGATYWGRPAATGIPSLDAEQARAVLDAYLGTATAAFEAAADPELVLVAVDAAPGAGAAPAATWDGPRGTGLLHELIWRFRFHDPDGVQLWVGEVDAHRGAVTAFFDGAHYTSIRGGVFPVSPDGDCAEDGCEIAGFPMPYADWTEDGQSEQLADAFGNLTCASSASDFTTNLDGTYVYINDVCGLTLESGSCSGGLLMGQKTGENCDTDPAISDGNTAAARTAYYQINQVAAIGRYYIPSNTWLQSQVEVRVNVDSTCNASWGGRVNMFRAGNGCGNTGENQGVLTHEWGHGLDENDGGGFDQTSEAYADVVALLASRESCMGRGFYTGGTCNGYGDFCLTCTGVRETDWDQRNLHTPATPQGFINSFCDPGGGGSSPCGGAGHCESHVITEAIYDLAARDLPAAGFDPASAWTLAERLWYETRDGSGGPIFTCSLPSSDSCASSTWYQRMRVADDDDGDLSNGTPHAAELFAAFDRHNIACGAASDANNQSSSGCPTLATPVVTLTEQPGGTELSWGAVPNADGYIVYRSELGCDRQALAVGTVGPAQTAFLDGESDPDLPRYYRVEAVGANAACRSMISNCESSPNGPRLQLNEYRVLEDPQNANANGLLDPGETAQLPMTLFNGGDNDALGVAGALRLTDPDQGRLLVDDAAWGTIGADVALESGSPHFELTVFEGTACGERLELTLEMQAQNATTRTRTFEISLGDPTRDFTEDSGAAIPNPTTAPVTQVINVAQDRTISELDVTVSVTHLSVTDLIVELTSPGGTTVRLHDQTAGGSFGFTTRYDLDKPADGPGSMDDFIGESTLGDWTLAIEDPISGGPGFQSLDEWTLHFTAANDPFDCDPFACGEATPMEPVDGLTVDRSGADLTLSWNPVAGAAGYHALQSPLAPFDAAVELAGRTSGATTLTLIDGVNTTPALTFFQLRAVNGCNQEGP